MTRTTAVTLLVALGLSASARAEAPARPRASGVDYLRDVKPILARKCAGCHGALKQKAGLRLDTAENLLRGGEGGSPVEPGKPDESELIDRVTQADLTLRMPPEGEGEKLSASEVETLRAWVVGGAKTPKAEPAPLDPRDHWAFRPPVRPTVPTARQGINPIDAFLSAGYEAHGLDPSPTAEKPVLLRRLYLDLSGIAPTPAEVKSFLDDGSDVAYEQVVDRLLSSPRYGERWGRHWMDVWRYSDWDGFGAEVRESQPHVWHWRDWIVESLNADTGYDRMVVAMLAADEAAPGDESALRATGYLARSWSKFSRSAWLDSVVEHTSKAFLGMTVNCARCHDHKYDPISQVEYYRFRAVFEPHTIRTDRIPGQPDTTKDGLASVYDANPETQTFLFVRGNEKEPARDKPLTPTAPSALGGKSYVVKPLTLPDEAAHPGLRRFVRDETIAQARAEVSAKEAEAAKSAKGSPAALLAPKALAAARAGLTAAEARVAADLAKYAHPPRPEADLLGRLAASAERQTACLKAEAAFAHAEGAAATARAALQAKPNDAPSKQAVTDAEAAQAAAQKALETARAGLAKTDAAYTPLGPLYPSTSTGRRLALANWIVARDNPLAARVAVNHVWMRHFSAPLVASVADFGLNGKGPTHPELLDWLAVEFMDRGWSFKALHRLIVTSQAYRMRSTAGNARAKALAADPENRYLWRQNPRRMEAEAVRDNVLAAAGALDPTMGGPDLDPALGETLTRRSLYFRHTKEKRMMFLKLFDSPNVTSCYRRTESVVPHQALALANSGLALGQAKALALALEKEVGADQDNAFVNAAFARVLGRVPRPEERSACLQFIADETRKLAAAKIIGPARRARADLVHVLFNHNDFLTIR